MLHSEHFASFFPLSGIITRKWTVPDIPNRLKGDQIPLSARILTTVDVYDALTTDRPYRKAFSVDKALEIMHDDARIGVLDTHLLAVFESLILERQGMPRGKTARELTIGRKLRELREQRHLEMR